MANKNDTYLSVNGVKYRIGDKFLSVAYDGIICELHVFRENVNSICVEDKDGTDYCFATSEVENEEEEIEQEIAEQANRIRELEQLLKDKKND